MTRITAGLLRRTTWTLGFFVTVLSASALTISVLTTSLACAQATEQPAATAETATTEAPTTEAPVAEPKTVDEGFEMLEKELNSEAPPKTMTQEERIAYIKTKIGRVLEIVEKVWALNPEVDQKKELIDVKVQMMSMLGRLGEPGAKDKVIEFLTKLSSDPNAEIAAVGKSSLTMMKINSIFELEPEEQTKLISEVKADILAGEPTVEKLQVASSLARAAGYQEDTKTAVDLNEEFAKFFSNSPDEQLKAAGEGFAGTARFMNLPGNSMNVVGKTVNDEPFDLAQHKGKVVLVDFWATWCGPCIAEFPNMTQLYELYKPHGFEIVGISLDANREQLIGFLEARKVPWIILHEESEEGGNTIADHYGINAIPAMVLVGTDGKVVSVKARGEVLREELAKLFPNVKAPAPEEE